jgi:hypothetical protein
MHGLFYTPNADELRAFIRDKLGFPFTDAGDGWLIFDVPSADLAVHPGDGTAHEISFFCDDIEATVADLRAKGVTFSGDIQEQGWGRVISFEMPGGISSLLYEPKYEKGQPS